MRRRWLLDIAGEGVLSPASRVHHALSLPPVRVALPELPIGATFLSRWAVREHPAGTSWQASAYDSMAPALFIIRDALVHSSAGIIAVGEDVVAETMVHTMEGKNGFSLAPDGCITLHTGKIRRLGGTHVTILSGAGENYFHATIEGVMRLAMVPPAMLAAADGLLCPAGAVAQSDMLALLELPPRREVRDDETLLVETLIYPWSVHGEANFHPCVGVVFDRISRNVAGPDRGFPRRVYIDRRGTRLRPLLNEEDVVHGLSALGFVPVRLESLGFADQVRLFRGAEAIVAPHGAGLTNLGYCRAGCVVLEIVMDAYASWIFRHLAALRGLEYDCVVGRAVPWRDRAINVQALRWTVSVELVVAGIAQMLKGQGALPPLRAEPWEP